MGDIAKPRLPVIDLLLLNHFNGRQEGYQLPAYELETYGHDWSARVQRLRVNGYLTFAEPPEALSSLTIPKLKEILREHGQKLSGKKSELITRILEHVPFDELPLPKVYALTAAGRHELDTRSFYIENRQMNYGFMNSELAELETSTSPDLILEKLFARNLLKYSMAHDYLSLSLEHEKLRAYLKRRGRADEAFVALLKAIYLRLTGMQDGNFIGDYQGLEYCMGDAFWRELDAEKTSRNLSDDDLAKAFVNAAQAVQVPFSYFDLPTMTDLILDRLHGQENLLTRYAARSRKPPDFDKPRESVVIQSQASGCLLPCVILILIMWQVI